MKRRIPKGFYLILDGPEGCGKSTQLNLLAERLEEEFNVLKIKEPGGTRLGEEIREILLDPQHESLDALTELFLFSADRRHLIQTIVSPALSDGKIVLSDRGHYSTEAYQGAGGKLDSTEIKKINNMAIKDVNYDLAMILDIDVEVGLERARRTSKIKDKIEARELEYHRRVRNAYLNIAKRDKEICRVIDASGSVREIHEEIYRIAKERIDRALKS